MSFPLGCRLLITAAAGMMWLTGAGAQEAQLNVGVRATVVDKPATGAGESREHGRIYGTMAVREVKSDQGLVKPVDEARIMQLLGEQLNANGYRLYSGLEKPHFVLSVSYGRGDVRFEKNPAQQVALEKTPDEKLYIRVVAWAYPADPNAQARVLWKTTMAVGDPDHRDLNAVAAGMLEAGAPYFDREIGDPEVNIVKPLPAGHVNVGTPALAATTASKAK